MQTLVDLFELNTRAPVSAARRTPVEEGAEGHDWGSSTTESSPGVSVESWHRARGWSSEEDGG
jgi:hypothetical protein